MPTRGTFLGTPVVPSYLFFGGFPTKMDYRQKGYPYSNLSTGGPSFAEKHGTTIEIFKARFHNGRLTSIFLVLKGTTLLLKNNAAMTSRIKPIVFQGPVRLHTGESLFSPGFKGNRSIICLLFGDLSKWLDFACFLGRGSSTTLQQLPIMKEGALFPVEAQVDLVHFTPVSQNSTVLCGAPKSVRVLLVSL